MHSPSFSGCQHFTHSLMPTSEPIVLMTTAGEAPSTYSLYAFCVQPRWVFYHVIPCVISSCSFYNVLVFLWILATKHSSITNWANQLETLILGGSHWFFSFHNLLFYSHCTQPTLTNPSPITSFSFPQRGGSPSWVPLHPEPSSSNRNLSTFFPTEAQSSSPGRGSPFSSRQQLLGVPHEDPDAYLLQVWKGSWVQPQHTLWLVAQSLWTPINPG